MPILVCPSCEAQIKIPEGLAGRKGKCNKCQAVFLIPADTSVQSTPPPPPPVPGGYAPPVPGSAGVDAGFPEEGPKPVRKRNKKKILLVSALLGSGVLLGMCLVCGVVGYFFVWPWMFGSNINADLKYLPDNPDIVFTMRPADIFGSTTYKRIVADNPDLEKMMESQQGGLSINQKDISFMVAGMKMPGPNQGTPAGTFVMHTTTDYTAEKLLSKSKDAKPETVNVGSYTIHKFGFDQGFCLVNSRTILVGNVTSLEDVLKRNKDADLSPLMKKAIGEVNFSKSAAFAAIAKAMNQGGKGGIPGMPNPDYVSGDAAIGSKVELRVVAGFGSTSEATDGKKMVDAGIVTLKGTPKIPPEFTQILTDLRIDQQGSRLVAQVTFDAVSLVQSSKKGFPLFPGGGF